MKISGTHWKRSGLCCAKNWLRSDYLFTSQRPPKLVFGKGGLKTGTFFVYSANTLFFLNSKIFYQYYVI